MPHADRPPASPHLREQALEQHVEVAHRAEQIGQPPELGAEAPWPTSRRRASGTCAGPSASRRVATRAWCTCSMSSPSRTPGSWASSLRTERAMRGVHDLAGAWRRRRRCRPQLRSGSAARPRPERSRHLRHVLAPPRAGRRGAAWPRPSQHIVATRHWPRLRSRGTATVYPLPSYTFTSSSLTRPARTPSSSCSSTSDRAGSEPGDRAQLARPHVGGAPGSGRAAAPLPARRRTPTRCASPWPAKASNGSFSVHRGAPSPVR